MLLKQLHHKGFAGVQTILMVVVIAIISGTGYYVYHSSQKASNDYSAASKASQSTPVRKTLKADSTSLPGYQFPDEKLTVNYDDKYWSEFNRSSSDIQCQGGPVRQNTFQLEHDKFLLSYQFGQCPGKGGGICFSDSPGECKRESRQIAKTGTNAHPLYVLASRSTIDSGKTWKYELFLDDDPNCTGDLCTLKATNIADDHATVSGYYVDPQPSVSSINQYLQQKEVQAAIKVLKTSKY